MSIVKEFVEKLIDRLEEKRNSSESDMLNSFMNYHQTVLGVQMNTYEKAIEIVNQLAEEYNPSKSSSLAEQIADDLSKVLKEAKSMGCKEVKSFHHIPLENLEIVINALRAYNQGWIPCSERLPEGEEYIKRFDGGLFYKNMLTTISDEILLCIGWYDQKEQVWFDSDGFMYYPTAWQPLPEPYKEP